MLDRKSIRARLRELLQPVSMQSSTDKATRREFNRLFQQCSPPERLLWHLIGEGEPERFPDRIFLVKLVPKSLRLILDHYRSTASAIGVWPEIPRLVRHPGVDDGTVDIYQVPPAVQATLFAQWERQEEQEILVDRVGHGIDNDLGEFLVPAKADVLELARLLPASTWSLTRHNTPDTARTLQAMAAIMAACGLVGIYLGAELGWALFMDKDCGRMAAVSQKLADYERVLLQREGDEWHVLEGTIPLDDLT